jgi:hypothetical protein
VNVLIPKNVELEPVARDTRAPWLSSGSDKWRLISNWTIYLDGMEWTVPKGYITDLASIPRLFWRMFPRGYGPSRRAAIFHDWCYSHGHRWCSKEYADEALRSIMIEDGAPEWAAWCFHRAVRLNAGGGGWSK